MLIDPSPLWLPCIAAFVLAGFVKGATGMGLPTVVMVLLAGVMPVSAAAALLVLPSLVTNAQQVLAGPEAAVLLRRLWPMFAALVAGTLLAAPLLAGGGHAVSPGWLGLVVIAYALQALRPRPWRVSAHSEAWLSPVMGTLAGVAGSATGVFLVPSVPYLQALGLERDALVQALALSFAVSTLALAAVLLRHGLFDARAIVWSAGMVVPALAGLAAGNALRRRISATVFRRAFLACLLLLGGELAWRAWG